MDIGWNAQNGNLENIKANYQEQYEPRPKPEAKERTPILRKVNKLLCLSVAAAYIGSLFSQGTLWTVFTTYLFFIAIWLLMIGGALLVLEGGMFDGMMYSFRHFKKHTSKKEAYISRQTKEWRPSRTGRHKFSLTYPFLFSGGALFLFTVAASLAQ
ncbi:DUF3899 domain-containing protein [Bacillus badius]|uniref:DUF3899 domain-containing protein n=1 Tax=Bacillus badius TaxID=1455 RepID=UPI000596EA51|nr:DUF3899 domain-containing protein [Bacillus badius]KZN98206.1 hypothetical protein A4244_10630 [Bacillus badius]KZR58492.1 hypothetical protein A3781_16485 [Bacillus badius]OCS82529.1 hypothetical protein A6M11_10645 [Bacillus badius]OVE50811.1 hypothetical protein B1A98_15380 [Bacillus badius]